MISKLTNSLYLPILTPLTENRVQLTLKQLPSISGVLFGVDNRRVDAFEGFIENSNDAFFSANARQM